MPTPILPEVPSPVSYEFKSKVNTAKSESLSGKILTRKIGGQRFELTLKYAPMTKSEFGEIAAFLNEQEGCNGIFFVRIPQLGDTLGAAGEYVNYDNHNKLYQIKSDGVNVYPDAIVDVTSATQVNNPVYLRCSLKGNVQQITYSADGFVRFEIDLVERL